MRIGGSSAFRREAKRGDLVVTIWQTSWKSRQARVYGPEVILRKHAERTATHFFVEELADRDDHSTSWSEFLKLWKRAMGTKFPRRAGMRELSPNAFELLTRGWRR